jgi:hypothetical protein
MTHTERTLALLRKLGLTADVVERFVRAPHLPGGGHRKDLFGVIDIIALAGVETIGVQSCGQAFAGHRAKIIAEPRAAEWLESPYRRLLLVGWRKVAAYRKDGTRAVRDRMAPRMCWFDLIGEEVQARPEEEVIWAKKDPALRPGLGPPRGRDSDEERGLGCQGSY